MWIRIGVSGIFLTVDSCSSRRAGNNRNKYIVLLSLNVYVTELIY